MRRKADNAARQDVALAERYKEIGISAVAAAARYQGSEKNKPAGAAPKDKSEQTKSFRGTSPTR